MLTAVNQKSYKYKPFSCEKCGSKFTRKDSLTYHLRFQCGKPPRFKCPYCKYCSRHASNVRKHIREYHPNQEIYFADVGV